MYLEMKKIIILIYFVIVAFLQITVAQKTVTVDLEATEARMKDALPDVHTRPIICDVLVKKYQAGAEWCKETETNTIEKSTSRFTDKWYITASVFTALLGNIQYFNEQARTELKNYGMFCSQQYHQCDVVIAPIFNFRTTTKEEKQKFGADFLIVISGYAADFVNFKNATEADMDLLIKEANLNGKGYNSLGVIPLMSK